MILHVLSVMCSFLLQQVQEKEVELSSVREELSSAVEKVELLASQLDDTRSRADPANVNAQLKLVRKKTLPLRLMLSEPHCQALCTVFALGGGPVARSGGWTAVRVGGGD